MPIMLEYTAAQKESIRQQKRARMKRFADRHAKNEEKREAYNAEHSKVVEEKPVIRWYEEERYNTKDKKG